MSLQCVFPTPYPKVLDAKSQANQSKERWAEVTQGKLSGQGCGVWLCKQKTPSGYGGTATWTTPLVTGLSYGMAVLEAGQ